MDDLTVELIGSQ